MAWAASPIHKRPGRYQRVRRSTTTVKRLTSFPVAQLMDANRAETGRGRQSPHEKREGRAAEFPGCALGITKAAANSLRGSAEQGFSRDRRSRRVCPGSVGRRLRRIHITSMGCAEIDAWQSGARADHGMASIGATVRLARISRGPCGVVTRTADDATILLEQIGGFGLHLNVEGGVTGGLAHQKIQKVPLRHEGQELAVGGR